MSSYARSHQPELYAIPGGHPGEDRELGSAGRLSLTHVIDNVCYIGRVIREGQSLGVRTKNRTKFVLDCLGLKGPESDEAWTVLKHASAGIDSPDQQPFMYIVGNGKVPKPVRHEDVGQVPDSRVFLVVDILCHNLFDSPSHEKFERRLGHLGPVIMSFAALSEETGPRSVDPRDKDDLLASFVFTDRTA